MTHDHGIVVARHDENPRDDTLEDRPGIGAGVGTDIDTAIVRTDIFQLLVLLLAKGADHHVPSRHGIGQTSLVIDKATGELTLRTGHGIAALRLGYTLLARLGRLVRLLALRLGGTCLGFRTCDLLGDLFLDLAVQLVGPFLLGLQLSREAALALVQLLHLLLLLLLLDPQFSALLLSGTQQGLFLRTGLLECLTLLSDLLTFLDDRVGLTLLPLGIFPQVTNTAQRLAKTLGGEDEQELVLGGAPAIEAIDRLGVGRLLLFQLTSQLVEAIP